MSKTKLKTKLSNTSSKSDDLHFELPEHLKKDDDAFAPDDTFEKNDDETNSSNKKKHKKGKKSKKTKKSKSEDQERDELEEFLNGVPGNQPEEGAYEEL